MRQLYGWVGLVFLLMCIGFGAQAEIVDGIVATVGTEVILHSELLQEIAPYLSDLQQNAANSTDFQKQAEERLKTALEEAIDNRILLREALLAGLEVKDEGVEERMKEIKSRFASNEEFLKEIEKAGETVSDLRDRIRKRFMAFAMSIRKHREFEKEANVSESEIAQFYKDHPDKFTHPERVRLRRIFLDAPKDAQERAQVKARIDELKKQLDAGSDFAELAKAYSKGPEAEQGGLMDWMTRDKLVANLADVAFSLSEGGVSDVLETEFGFVIVKLEKKETAGTSTLDDARKDIEPELRKKFAEEKFKKYIAELRKRSRVRVFLS